MPAVGLAHRFPQSFSITPQASWPHPPPAGRPRPVAPSERLPSKARGSSPPDPCHAAHRREQAAPGKCHAEAVVSAPSLPAHPTVSLELPPGDERGLLLTLLSYVNTAAPSSRPGPPGPRPVLSKKSQMRKKELRHTWFWQIRGYPKTPWASQREWRKGLGLGEQARDCLCGT